MIKNQTIMLKFEIKYLLEDVEEGEAEGTDEEEKEEEAGEKKVDA